MRHGAWVALVALLASCNRYANGRGQMETDVDVRRYRYIIVDGNSAGAPEVTNALVERGFSVVTGSIDWLSRYDFTPHSALLAKCTDLGRVKRDLGASSVARVSCQVLDAATHQVVYNGVGEHANPFGDFPRIGPAAALALKQFPSTGRVGGVTEVLPAGSFRPHSAQ